MRDFIAKFVENYVSVPDLVTGLLVTAIGGNRHFDTSRNLEVD